jgi:cyclophilin family peptidyl-prolyl cis-trans isomerase
MSELKMVIIQVTKTAPKGSKRRHTKHRNNRIPTMTLVKRGFRPAAVTRKMQRTDLLKIGLGIMAILGFVALLLRNDPFPTVRKNSMRQQISVKNVVARTIAEAQQQQELQEGGAAADIQRDFRDPNAEEEESDVGEIDVAGKEEVEEGRLFTIELSSLKDGATGSIVIRTKPSWAPLGVEHLHELIDANYFENAKFFRVVPNFMVQFGIAAIPTDAWKKPFKDDPVLTTNARATLTYATSGPNSRSTQLFINTRQGGNTFLDKQGFAPIGEVIRYVALCFSLKYFVVVKSCMPVKSKRITL